MHYPFSATMQNLSPSLAFKLRHNQRSGFTLIEMLVVVAVIVLITAAVAPMVFSTLVATRLTSAGQTITSAISLAREHAVSGGQEVELRFYQYAIPEEPGSEDAYRAIVMVLPAKDPTEAGTQLGEILRCPSGIIIGDSQALSPLLNSNELRSMPDKESFIRSATARYKAFRFRPNGTTDLTEDANKCYFTLAEERLVDKGRKVPPNFFAIQIDPLSSRTEIYRP
jgi:uncharacterized protein (TIGR02596 family)